jgi:DNA primase
MYRQEKLTVLKDGFVLIVEGERCAEDAQQIIGNTGTAITWPFGAASTGQVDWTPLYGRKIIIWPDNDSDGLKAAEAIFELLELHVPEINILNVSDKPNKWDASDALAEGYSLDLEDITLNQPNLLKEKL